MSINETATNIDRHSDKLGVVFNIARENSEAPPMKLMGKLKTADTGILYTTFKRACNFAIDAHGTQKYADDRPYYEHLIEVALRVSWIKPVRLHMAVAMLHDIMEDCGVSYIGLKELFGDAIATSVEYLSSYPRQPYDLYIDTVSKHAIARAVKIADLESNLLACLLTDTKESLIPKYVKALRMLKEDSVL